MVLTKQYLRYVPKGLFNLVGSGRGGAVFLDKKGELAAVAAAQDVVIWDLKKKERLRTLPGTKHEVTSICVNETGILVAVGYNDGSIKLFDSGSGESEVTFTGHKSAVNSLAYDQVLRHEFTGSFRPACIISLQFMFDHMISCDLKGQCRYFDQGVQR